MELKVNSRALAVRVLPSPVKRRILHHRRQALNVLIRRRIRSGRLGPPPTFLILGYGKCGTTELYDRLLEHPNVPPSLTKEVNYFIHQYRQGLDWYLAHFASALDRSEEGPIAVGEASPGYVCHPHAPDRIAELVPDVKLIVLLRDPVARAYSHYHHQRRLGYEPLPTFEEAVEAEPDRIRGETERMRDDPTYRGFDWYMYSYLEQGIYANHLPWWLDRFPRENLLILQSESFYRDTAATLRDITAFLGLPDWAPRESKDHKSFHYPRMKPETRARLQEYFAPHNERLYAMLGVDYGWSD